jgi:hypothetical protein
MNKLGSLILNRFDYSRMRVAGCNNGDAGVEIQVAIAIDIPNFAAQAVIHHKRVHAAGNRSQHLIVAADHLLGLRAGPLSHDLICTCLRHASLLALRASMNVEDTLKFYLF